MKLWKIEATFRTGAKASIKIPARHGETVFGMMERLYSDANVWQRFVDAMPGGPDDIASLAFHKLSE